MLDRQIFLMTGLIGWRIKNVEEELRVSTASVSYSRRVSETSSCLLNRENVKLQFDFSFQFLNQRFEIKAW